MNWLKRAQWQAKGLDVGEHLRNVFRIQFQMEPVATRVFDNPHIKSGTMYYLPSMDHTYRRDGELFPEVNVPRGTYEHRLFYFVHNDKLYNLNVPIGKCMNYNNASPKEEKMKFLSHGIMGELKRLYKKSRISNVPLGEIKSDTPYEFAQQVKSLIESDFDPDDNEEDEELAPEPPSPNMYRSPVNSPVLSLV